MLINKETGLGVAYTKKLAVPNDWSFDPITRIRTTAIVWGRSRAAPKANTPEPRFRDHDCAECLQLSST